MSRDLALGLGLGLGLVVTWSPSHAPLRPHPLSADLFQWPSNHRSGDHTHLVVIGSKSHACIRVRVRADIRARARVPRATPALGLGLGLAVTTRRNERAWEPLIEI